VAFCVYTFLVLDGLFTPKLLLPVFSGALIICNENVQLWHPFLAKGDTSDTFEIGKWGLFVRDISILRSKNTLNSV
jgi:hypothetical protein